MEFAGGDAVNEVRKNGADGEEGGKPRARKVLGQPVAGGFETRDQIE